jgi:hypothetical protein
MPKMTLLTGGPHHLEALQHLIRIRARVANDAVAQQLAINKRLAGNVHQLDDIGQKVLDAIMANQTEPHRSHEIVFSKISLAVEAACQGLGLDLQKGVVRGVLPIRGLGAFSSDFYGTGIAIVGIDGSLVPFTGMLTDLFVDTFEYEETIDDLGIVPNPARCPERLTGGKTILETASDAREGRDSLIHYWERFFLHFAGFSLPWPKASNLTETQRTIKFQLTSAMEVFVVAHEYGHHIHKHNAGATASSALPPGDAYAQELEADRTAWLVAKHLGAIGFAGQPTEIRNSWMEASAGAVAYLAAAEMVRRTREILETGTMTEPQSLTHPSIRERLAALEGWDSFDESSRAEFRVRRWFLCNLIEQIYNYVSPKFYAAHEAGFRPTHL